MIASGMILETAFLHIRPGETAAFEIAMAEARHIIGAADGFRAMEVRRCLADDHRYLLLVSWETLEDHVIGFRESDRYQKWRALLHHFYDPFPTVAHFAPPCTALTK